MNARRLLEAMRHGAVDPFHAALYHGGGKGSAPPAPDYRGAAMEESAASKELAAQQTFANRPTINTPWGQQTWNATYGGTDPATGAPVTNWTTNINLTPQEQAALDSQQRIQQGRSQAAETLLGQATSAFQTPFNWSGMPQVGSLEDAQGNAFTKMSAMLQPGRTQQQEQLNTRLANMGLPMDSEGYRRANADLSNQWAQQDKGLLAEAMGAGRADIGVQQGLRQQAIAEETQRRGMTLNELNALLTEQQVNMPQMPGVNPAAAGQAPQLLQAATAQGNYGLQAQQMANQQGGQLGQLIGTGAMAAATIM